MLTHAHLDHSGYLPKLVADGFRGPIYATPATRAVAELILRDSGYLQEKDAEYANRKGYTKHKPARPLYGVKDAERALEAFVEVDFHATTTALGDAALTYRRAGHILGAATASIDWGGLMAASVIITTPVMVMALFAQKYIVAGLSAGATKG